MCNALEYVMSGINEYNCHDIVGVPLLPLKGSPQAVNFEKRTVHNHKYIIIKSLVGIIPRVDHLLVDPELSENLTKKLHDMAEANCLQLVLANAEIMYRWLLPRSVHL